MTHPRNLAPAPNRNAVLTKAMLRAAERLGLSGRQLAEIVGVSEATVSRLKRGEATLEAGSKPSTRSLATGIRRIGRWTSRTRPSVCPYPRC